jgi:hypothetical protein
MRRASLTPSPEGKVGKKYGTGIIRIKRSEDRAVHKPIRLMGYLTPWQTAARNRLHAPGFMQEACSRASGVGGVANRSKRTGRILNAAGIGRAVEQSMRPFPEAQLFVGADHLPNPSMCHEGQAADGFKQQRTCMRERESSCARTEEGCWKSLKASRQPGVRSLARNAEKPRPCRARGARCASGTRTWRNKRGGREGAGGGVCLCDQRPSSMSLGGPRDGLGWAQSRGSWHRAGSRTYPSRPGAQSGRKAPRPA